MYSLTTFVILHTYSTIYVLQTYSTVKKEIVVFNIILCYLSCEHVLEVVITVHVAPIRHLLFIPW